MMVVAGGENTASITTSAKVTTLRLYTELSDLKEHEDSLMGKYVNYFLFTLCFFLCMFTPYPPHTHAHTHTHTHTYSHSTP